MSYEPKTPAAPRQVSLNEANRLAQKARAGLALAPSVVGQEETRLALEDAQRRLHEGTLAAQEEAGVLLAKAKEEAAAMLAEAQEQVKALREQANAEAAAVVAAATADVSGGSTPSADPGQ